MTSLARTPRQIGTLVRRARKKKGISQTELADKVGTRQATVSMIETGNSAVKLATLLAVLAALDLELRIAPRSQGVAEIEDIF